jgi:hypothetical protein
MKKQASDQQFHDRRHQQRKRAEAAQKPLLRKSPQAESTPAPVATVNEATRKEAPKRD